MFFGGINLGGFGAGPNQVAISAAGEAQRSQTAARSAEDHARDAEDRIDKLTLICMAMWSLLQEKTGLTEEDLMKRVSEIDLMDGVEDGKMTRTVRKCAKCGRTMNPRHHKCLYCGAEELKTSAFDEMD